MEGQLKGYFTPFFLTETHKNSPSLQIGKRGLDILLASIGLLLLFLFLPLLGLAIRLDSHGPIFYSQLRMGQFGRKFRLWKLRTMVVNAEQQGATWTEAKDPRITRVGKILRKTHLDEFPQFWNVLIGDMSVVGVRPLSVDQCELFARKIPHHDLRHLVKPGITGWAAVNFRYVNNLEGAHIRLEYDLYYLRHQTMWLDLWIILHTVWILAAGKGM